MRRQPRASQAAEKQALSKRNLAESRLKRLNERLEQRVAQRTLELRSLNAQLARQMAELAATKEELVQQNRELRTSQEQLQFERARYQDLFEAAPDAYLVTDMWGMVLEANLAARSLFNGDAVSLEFRSLRDLFGEEHHRLLTSVLGRLKGKEQWVQDVEVVLRTSDRRPVTTLLRVNTIQKAPGEPQGLRWQFHDITARKLFQAELERLVAERTRSLEEMTHQLNDFCYSMAHDLKAPIRAQVGFAQTLISDFGDALGPQGRIFAERIAEAAQRQGKLVNDLLAHLGVDRAEMPLEPLNLQRVIEQVRADLRAEEEQKQALIEVGPLHGPVLANPASLHLVLSNLVSNALKFMPVGRRPEITLWTELRQPGNVSGDGHGTRAMVRLCVRDNGIGIDPKHWGRIWGVFHRLHTQDVYPGTGIGLAIVKRAVERMGGQVGLDSALGKGSCFWVDLPSGVPPESEPPAAFTARAPRPVHE